MSQSFKNNFKASEKAIVSLSVYNVGFQKCDPCHQWGPGVRDHYLIHYIMSGKGHYKTDGREYTLNAGDAFLVYPYTEVTYYADETDPWEYYWVGFSGSDAAAILNATDFTKSSPVISQHPDGSSVQKQLYHIYEARGNEFSHTIEMTGRLYTTLAIFVRDASLRSPKQDTYQSYAGKGMEYIYANYSYDISVEDIAAYVGISRSHLFRAFRQCCDMSPKEFLTWYRIRQACVLLRQSNLSVTAIANSVGFEDSLYFSKAFHKRKGMTPSEYAASHT